MGDNQVIVDRKSQGTGSGQNLAGQSLVPFGRLQTSSRMVVLCAVISYVEFLQF
jgi:hypothetical protein